MAWASCGPPSMNAIRPGVIRAGQMTHGIGGLSFVLSWACKVLLGLALAVALGGDRLSDVAVPQAQPQVFGPAGASHAPIARNPAVTSSCYNARCPSWRRSPFDVVFQAD